MDRVRRSLQREFTGCEGEPSSSQGEGAANDEVTRAHRTQSHAGEERWASPCRDHEAEPNWLTSGCLGMHLRSAKRHCQAGRN